ncbi:MAG: hypothetical protein R2844_03270 [Caldilineales bacterium]
MATRLLLILLLLALQPVSSALAHGGGTPQLVKERAGAYALYVWTNPDPVRVGTMHVSVALVQPDTEAPVLNADVRVTATPETGNPITSTATHENATVKTYYETDMAIPQEGPWQVAVSYQIDDAGGSASFPVQVQRAGMNMQPIALGVVVAVVGGGIIFMGRRNRRPAAPAVPDQK